MIRAVPIVACLCLALLPPAGCARKLEKKVVTPRYAQLPAKDVPPFLRGTVLERVDLVHTEPVRVSGYGLVVNLEGTGDTTAPTRVRDFIIKQMVRYGYGLRGADTYKTISPETVLKDPRVAIVRVDGLVPPGARAGQRFDVQVSALPGSQTSSLAGGTLWRADLKPLNPYGEVDTGPEIGIIAKAQGAIFVNPAYALDTEDIPADARDTLKYGVAMDGGMLLQDRPLALRVRQPSRAVARLIEARVQELFQSDYTSTNYLDVVARAKDEGLVYVLVPDRYGTDWEHAAGVVLHTYFSTNGGEVVRRAKELADLAAAPDAPLADITYGWEALGPNALPFVAPLMTSRDPAVAYAAARAAAFLGDRSAQDVLLAMAGAGDHPFRLNAVETLGRLPASPAVNRLLRELLDDPAALVRVAAYKALVNNRDPAVHSNVVGRTEDDPKFVLDVIPSSGPPLIYASRRGVPRIAVFGERARLATPITYLGMDDRLSISSDPDGGAGLTLYHRPTGPREPVKVRSNPDLPEVIARLGGMGADGTPAIDLNYGQIVALLQQLGQTNQMVALASAGPGAANVGMVPAPFVLQDLTAAAAGPPPATGARPSGGDTGGDEPATDAEFIPPSQLPRQVDQGPTASAAPVR